MYYHKFNQEVTSNFSSCPRGSISTRSNQCGLWRLISSFTNSFFSIGICKDRLEQLAFIWCVMGQFQSLALGLCQSSRFLL